MCPNAHETKQFHERLPLAVRLQFLKISSQDSPLFLTGTPAMTGDVYRIDGVKRDTQKMHLRLRLLARNENTTAMNKTVMKSIKAVDDENIGGNTVATYIDIFRRLFVTDDQMPFSAGIRSSVWGKQAEKRYFPNQSLSYALFKAPPPLDCWAI